MEDYANQFLKLLRYARYIRNDKVKTKCLLSRLPQVYKGRIKFDKPRTLEEAIRKTKSCYDQNVASETKLYVQFRCVNEESIFRHNLCVNSIMYECVIS